MQSVFVLLSKSRATFFLTLLLSIGKWRFVVYFYQFPGLLDLSPVACILRVSIWCIEFSYLFNHWFLFFYTFQISNSICASFYCLASSLKYLLRQMFHCGGRSLNQVFSIFWSWLPLSILIVYWQCYGARQILI